jgi:hypothetical protein
MGVEWKKATFTITIWYFKPNGKFYTEATFEWTGRACGDGPTPTCYMQDVVAHIRGLNGRGQGSLYGLSSNSGGWDGPIIVNCDQGYPCLILPSAVAS